MEFLDLFVNQTTHLGRFVSQNTPRYFRQHSFHKIAIMLYRTFLELRGLEEANDMKHEILISF